MHEHEPRDITIIGAGPTGLFALFYAGMRGITAQVIDALPDPGGQLTALYPEKYIFDVAGLPKVLAKDLVAGLMEQAKQFQHPVHLGQRVLALEEEAGRFTVVTDEGRFPTRAIVIAAGIGAFAPRRLPQQTANPWYGRGIFDRVLDPAQFEGQRVVIIGGGDSAFDWAHQMHLRTEMITLMHRTDRYRAHSATVGHVRAAEAAGRVAMLPFHEFVDVRAEGDRMTGIIVHDVKTKTRREIDADAVLPMLGFVSDLGPLASWGLTFDKGDIVVSSTMETGRSGLYAAGDIATYPGKLKLIATGFGEAATAVNQAVHWIYPEKKVTPGHSSDMAIFGQQPE